MLVTTHTPMVRPFDAADLAHILNRDGSQVPAATVLEQAATGPAWTAVLDDQPLGCGGLTLPWPGVGMAWMVLSADMLTHHRIWLTRTVKAFLDDMTRLHALHRIEAMALEDTPRNGHWLEALGFTVEQAGRARAYLTDHRTMIRYERLEGL